MNTAVAQAAARLEQRASVARQILADLGHIDLIIPVSRFNDDDYYVYNAESLELITSHGCKTYRFIDQVPVKPGQAVAKGMRAKWLGLWRIAA
jgi:hypothetical protein